MTALGTKIDPRSADVRVDGKLLRAQPLRYVLLNKPAGYITTTSDERGRRTVMDLVPAKERIYPVGRLDRDTEGLLLLTNDGDVANRVMHPRYALAKEYHVLTPGRPSDATMQRVREGVTIEGRRVVPDEIRLVRETRAGLLLTIVIHEGLFHVVRRIMDAVGIQVAALQRIRLGPLSVSGISVGGWRDLTPGEHSTLYEALRLDRDGSAPSPDQPDNGSRRPPRSASTDARPIPVARGRSFEGSARGAVGSKAEGRRSSPPPTPGTGNRAPHAVTHDPGRDVRAPKHGRDGAPARPKRTPKHGAEPDRRHPGDAETGDRRIRTGQASSPATTRQDGADHPRNRRRAADDNTSPSRT